jgi:toxin ParE1/3/4
VATKTLEWTIRAQRHVLEIHDYIALDNPKAAERVLLAIRKAADSLLDFPMIAPASEVAGLRELNMTKHPYTLAYKLTASKIFISSVIHQSRAHRL